MATKAASKIERGTKRTCQNPECGARFYDLAREPIICAICNTTYAPAAPAMATMRTYQRPVKKRVVDVDEVKPVVAADDEEPPAIDAEEEPAIAEDDETLIEEVEEDSPDVAGIIDAPIEPDEKS